MRLSNISAESVPPDPKTAVRHPAGAVQDAGHRITVIESRDGWRALDFAELWNYRELLHVLTMRDIKVRYKQTVLGAAWAIIQPLMMMVVFTIFFGNLARMPSDGFPYPIFVFAALLPWTFFANAVASAGNSLVGSAHLVSKVYFPRVIIPLSSIGGGLLDFVIASGVMLVLMIWYGVGWSLNLLAVLPLTAGMVLAALGVGMLLSALIVTYRDFRYVIPFLIQFWMFATPVVYPASLVPEAWRPVLHLNPMAGIIEGYRSALLGRPFDFAALAISLTVAALIFAAGLAYFERMERRFADVI